MYILNKWNLNRIEFKYGFKWLVLIIVNIGDVWLALEDHLKQSV